MTVTTSFAGRFARRVRSRRVSRLKVALTVVSLLFVLGVGAWLVLVSSLFGVTAVQVQGASRVSGAQVLSAASIARGTPLARLDTAGVAAAVGRLAPVRSVQVHRDWPRGVTIVVQERVPAAVQERGDGFTLVDRSGVGFDVVARRPAGLPLVDAPAGAGPDALRTALDVLAAVPLPVRDQVTMVRAASADEVSLRLTRHRIVVWGSPDRSVRKGAVLAVLLSRRAAIYDVSAPDAPTTRT